MGYPDDDNIFRSPFAEIGKKILIPVTPLHTFLFESIRMNSEIYGERPLMIDAIRDQTILYKEIEPLSKQFASALTRMGFKKGDVLFYLTYNSSFMCLLHFGVWLCGGATRGYCQREEKGEVEQIMREVGARFALCERETSEAVKWAAGRLGWPVQLLCIDGEVDGATPVEDMVYKDDGSAYKEVDINPKEDAVYIPSTNGSTGRPKGTVLTHYNTVSALAGMGAPMKLTSFAHHYEIEAAGSGISKSYCVAELDNEFHVSCGYLVTFIEAKILDLNSGKPLGTMEKGKLLVRSPYMFKGYIQGLGKELKIVVDEDGWFDSGDIAFFDEGGRLYIVDRLNSIFKYYSAEHSSRLKVSPAEIEAIISRIPAVLSVGIMGVPNPQTSFTARAYVVARPGCNITAEEIKEYVAANTPPYKHLHGGVVFMDKLPETHAGKMDKMALMKQAKDEVKSVIS